GPARSRRPALAAAGALTVEESMEKAERPCHGLRFMVFPGRESRINKESRGSGSTVHVVLLPHAPEEPASQGDSPGWSSLRKYRVSNRDNKSASQRSYGEFDPGSEQIGRASCRERR